MMILDDFLESFGELEAHARSCEFADYVNPADGVTYPYICGELPERARAEVLARLEELMGGAVESRALFLRMSPKGVHCPHPAHHDAAMGQYSCMLYLSDGPGGTALLRHRETGIAYAPESMAFARLLAADQSAAVAWEAVAVAAMQRNRAFVFDARRMHCALPLGGFGESQADARIVLTCFFDRAETEREDT